MTRAAATLAAALAASLVAQGAQQRQTFRSGTQVVEVDARVLDKDGRFVTDLTADDFEITEDGVAQRIQSVTLVGAPGAPERPASSTEHQAPGGEQQPSSPHSTWLFVFDTPHLSPGALQRTRAAVAKFIDDGFREGDMGGVVANGRMMNNRLTSNRGELKKAVESLQTSGDVRSLQLDMREWPRLQDEYEVWRIAVQNDTPTLERAVRRACAEDPQACRGQAGDEFARAQLQQKAARLHAAYQRAARITLNVLQALANGLARMPGPKSVVLLSEGFFLQDLETELRQVVGQANRAGAHIYAIDARGLNKGTNMDLIDQPVAFNPEGPSNRFELNLDGPSSLAVDTGGFLILNENNFGRALDDIRRDASTYYVLAYAPSNQAFDGKYRGIRVSVKRGGVKVRARLGYLAVEPARMLVPRAITPASAPAAAPSVAAGTEPATPPAAAAPSTAPASGGTPAEAPSAPASAPPAATGTGVPNVSSAADAIRARIDNGHIVEALRGDATAATDSASRGWEAYQRGDVETASRELADAAKASGARPWVSYALGLSQLALQRYKDAADAWERVRGAQPDFEPVYFNLADAYLLQGNDSAALAVLRDAQQRWPKDDEVYDAVGVIQVRRGALDAAIESFQQAIAAAPSEPRGYFNLARAHHLRAQRVQRFDRATERWVGGADDRRKAAENYRRCIELGGPYAQQARDALTALEWK